jgi:glutaminase
VAQQRADEPVIKTEEIFTPDHALSPIEAYLAALHARHAATRDGEVASYIPEIATADPDWFGICIATVDGHVYEVGDSRQPFTIQSISKPLVYGLALEDRGRERVLDVIGVEPSGEAFNSISLAPGSGSPLNPMINAGAIAAASLVKGDSPSDRFDRILGLISLYAGRRLDLDEKVYRSERATGHRNRAIGHMLRNFDILAEDPEGVLDLYFRQCSILVDCRDLAVIAATLAGGGTNPVTHEQAIRPDLVENLLSVMVTCGMYDYAGEWVYRVGIPAKSGVAGGIMAVLPGQLGIGVFSPRLDLRGNSVRGVGVCQDLSRDMNLHFLAPPRFATTALRTQRSLATVRSKRRRRPADNAILDEHGGRVKVFEAQGSLRFAAAEVLVRYVSRDRDDTSAAVIDLRRVTEIDRAASQLLLELQLGFEAAGKQLVFSSMEGQQRFARFLEVKTLERSGHPPTTFPTLDRALDWSELQLLRQFARPGTAQITLADHQLCADFSAQDIAYVEEIATRHAFKQGDFIFRMGDAADRVYFLMSGEVSVVAEMRGGRLKRLSTSSAGMSFGESALLAGGTRSADVLADTRVECWSLDSHALAALDATRPALKIALLRNALRAVSEIAQRLTGEVIALEA